MSAATEPLLLWSMERAGRGAGRSEACPLGGLGGRDGSAAGSQGQASGGGLAQPCSSASLPIARTQVSAAELLVPDAGADAARSLSRGRVVRRAAGCGGAARGVSSGNDSENVCSFAAENGLASGAPVGCRATAQGAAAMAAGPSGGSCSAVALAAARGSGGRASALLGKVAASRRCFSGCWGLGAAPAGGRRGAARRELELQRRHGSGAPRSAVPTGIVVTRAGGGRRGAPQPVGAGRHPVPHPAPPQAPAASRTGRSARQGHPLPRARPAAKVWSTRRARNT